MTIYPSSTTISAHYSRTSHGGERFRLTNTNRLTRNISAEGTRYAKRSLA